MKNEPKMPKAIASQRGATGLTLIELGFVIVILAVIVALVLGFYNTLSKNKQVADVVTDVANIRQAVSTWSGGLPLTEVTIARDGTTRAQLRNWGQLADVLSGRLAVLARNKTSDQLDGANAWDSTYTIEVGNTTGEGDDAVTTGGSTWTLTIDKIPPDLAPRLRDRLVAAGEYVPIEDVVTDLQTITLNFDVG